MDLDVNTYINMSSTILYGNIFAKIAACFGLFVMYNKLLVLLWLSGLSFLFWKTPPEMCVYSLSFLH